MQFLALSLLNNTELWVPGHPQTNAGANEIRTRLDTKPIIPPQLSSLATSRFQTVCAYGTRSAILRRPASQSEVEAQVTMNDVQRMAPAAQDCDTEDLP